MTPTMQEMLEALKNPPQQCANIDTGEMADAFRVVFTAAQLDWLRALLSRAGEGEEICLACDGAGKTPMATMGSLIPPAERRELDQRAADNPVTCWKCHGTGKAAAPPSPALEAEPVARETVGVQVVHALMQLTDGSNWPEELSGPEFRGYRDAMEAVGQVVMDFQREAYAEQRTLAHPPASQPAQAVDREVALEIADRVRAQNWKNGGVLAMDRDEAADAILSLLDGGQQ